MNKPTASTKNPIVNRSARRILTGSIAAACAVALLGSPAARAVNVTWDSDGQTNPNDSIVTGGTGAWDTATNANWTTDGGTTNVFWNNAGNDTAVLGGTAGTVTLGTGITIGGLTFNDNAGYVVTGNTLTLGTAGVITANVGAQIDSSLDAASLGLTFAGAGNMTVSSAIANGATLAKNDAGLLTLTGTNGFTGATINGGTITGGTLSLSGGVTALASSATSAVNSNITITTAAGTITSSAGTLTLGGTVDAGSMALVFAGAGNTTLSNAIANGTTLSKSGNGTLTLSGASTFTGGVTLSAGTLNINVAGSAGVDGPLGNGGTFAINGGVIDNTSGSANVVLNVNPVTLGGNFAFSTAAGTALNNLTLPGAVSMAVNRTVTLNGAGTLTLSGLLTNTADSVRTLTVNNGAGTTSASLLSLGSYDLTGPGSTAARTDIINGTGNVTITGVVGNGVSAGSGLTYSGSGTLTLGGANTYTGPTAISSGKLQLTNTGALANSSGLTMANGTTLQLRSDTPATFTTPAITPPAGTITFDVDRVSGSNTNNTLTLSGGLVANNQQAAMTIGTTGANGYALSIPTVSLTQTSGTNSPNLTFNPTGANVSIGTITVLCNGKDALITLDGTTTGNSITTINDTSVGATQFRMVKQGTGTWSLGTASVRNTVTVSLGTLKLNGTLTVGRSGTSRDLLINGGQLDYNNAGAVTFAVGSTGGTITFAGGNLDQTSGAAITTSTTNPTQAWNANFTFIGSNGANSDLYMGTGAVTMNATRQVTVTNAATTLSIGGVIFGAGFGLTKAGAGTLSLSGASTYSGTTTVTAGTLAVANNLALQNSLLDTTGAGTVALSVTTPTIGGLAGAVDLATKFSSGYTGAVTALTLNLQSGTQTYSGALANGATGMTLTKTGAGTQILSGTNTYTGATTVSAGTLQFGQPASLYNGVTASWVPAKITVATGATLAVNVGGGGDFSAADLDTLLDNSHLGSSTASTGLTSHTSLGLDTSNGSFSYSTAIANPSSGANVLGLTKLGTNTLTLSGANTYTGQTTINGGILQINASANLGNATGGNSLAFNGSTLQSTANSYDLTANRTIALIGAGTIRVDAGTLTVSGIIGGAGTLTKTGVGTLALSGVNNFTGTTTVSAGTLAIGNNLALQNSVLDTTGAGDLTFTGFTTPTIGGLSGAVDLATKFTTGFSSVTTLTLNPLSGSQTYSGIIGNGAMALTKTGVGTQILSGANTYTGTTTINAGILTVGNGTAGSLNGTTGTALTFSGTGTFNVAEAASSNQGMGLLTFSAGDGTVQSTFASTAATLTFSDVAARTAGATGNFIRSGGAITTNKTVLSLFNGGATPTGSLLDRGLFFGGSKYAAYDLTDGNVRAYTTGDTDFVTSVGGVNAIVDGSTTNVALTTANVTAQNTAAINTLNLTSTFGVALAAAQTLTVNGILKAGNNTSTGISGGTGIQAASGAELVIRTDLGSDLLTITSPILANGTNALTKSGAGTLTLNATNAFTGGITINGGALTVSTVASWGPTGKNVTFNGSATLTSSVATYSGGILAANAGTATIAGTSLTFASATGSGAVIYAPTTAGQTLTITNGSAFNGNLRSQMGGATNTNPTVSFQSLGDAVGSFLQFGGSSSDSGQTATINLTGAGGTVTFNNRQIQIVPRTSTNWDVSLSTLQNNQTNGGTNKWVINTPLSYTSTQSRTLVLGGTNTGDNEFAGLLSNGTAGGTLNLSKTGGGKWILSGVNTYTGSTTISVGALNIQNATALGTTAAGTSVTSGAALQIQGGITVGAEALTLSGTGVSTTGALRNISGTNDYGGLVTLGAATRINSDADTLTLSNTGTITGAVAALTLGGAGNITINSIIGTTTGTLTKDGAGTATLSGISSYTGATTVSVGTLIAGTNAPSGSNGAFGNAVSEVVLGTAGGSSAASILTGGAFTVGRIIRIPTNNTTDAGTRVLTLGGNTAANSEFSGNIFLGTTDQAGRGVTLTAATGGQVTFSGVIQNPTGMDATTYTVTKNGPGTVVFSNANTYTGLTAVSRGVLQMGVNAAINPGNAVTVSPSVTGETAALNLNGFALTIGTAATSGLTFGGLDSTTTSNVTGTGAGSILTLAGTTAAVTYLAANNPLGASILATTVNLNNAAQTFTIGDSATAANDLTVSSAVVSGGGSGALIKAGAGTLKLDGSQGYDTLTANAGTTNVNGALGTIPANGTASVSVTGSGTKLRFGSVSQTLSSLSIGANSTVVFTSGTASGAFSGGGKSAALGGGSAVVPEPGTLGLLLRRARPAEPPSPACVNQSFRCSRPH